MRAASVQDSDARSADSLGDSVTARKSTNVTLPVGLVAQARALAINISQAAEAGIAAEVARRRKECWLAENREALETSNAFVEQHGLPLARYRSF